MGPSLSCAQGWTPSFTHAQQLGYSPSPNLAFLRLNFVLKLKAILSIIPALRQLKQKDTALHPGMEYIARPCLKKWISINHTKCQASSCHSHTCKQHLDHVGSTTLIPPPPAPFIFPNHPFSSVCCLWIDICRAEMSFNSSLRVSYSMFSSHSCPSPSSPQI